jgi:hypothetical protein
METAVTRSTLRRPNSGSAVENGLVGSPALRPDIVRSAEHIARTPDRRPREPAAAQVPTAASVGSFQRLTGDSPSEVVSSVSARNAGGQPNPMADPYGAESRSHGLGAMTSAALRTAWLSCVGELLVPVRSSFGGEVEEVP